MVSRPPVNRDVVRVGKDHPDTSHAAAAKALPRSGTLRSAVFGVIAAAGSRGATDDEIEQALGRSHQSVSGARNTLLRDDLIRDSGLRRPTRYHNDAIAWVTVDAAHQSEALQPMTGLALDDDLFDDDQPTSPVPDPAEGQRVGVFRSGAWTLAVPLLGQPAVLSGPGGQHLIVLTHGHAALLESLANPFGDEESLADALAQVSVPLSCLAAFAGLTEPWESA